MAEPRRAARVVLLDRDDRVLLLRAHERTNEDHAWWVMPGGGLEADETFERAAKRELFEETGLDVPIGRCVWTRRHLYEFRNATLDQVEHYFLARTTVTAITPIKADDYVTEARWWTIDELHATRDELAPRKLATLLADILVGRIPESPIDCGV